jgi:hypothetical protein
LSHNHQGFLLYTLSLLPVAGCIELLPFSYFRVC